MIDRALRTKLLALRDKDWRVGKELIAANELGGSYHPRMEAVHAENARRLRELIAQHGWPAADVAGEDGAEAAWLIAQHAVGEPAFMKHALELVRECGERKRCPAWHAAYLEDRIALYESRPQRFGSQWMDDPRDGLARPWTLADPEHVDELRASAGLKPLHAIPPPGPELAREVQEEHAAQQKWWLDWLASRGWRAAR
jgi:hypothetical protein